MIIGLSGYISVGKDEVGRMIQYLTSKQKASYLGSYNSYVMDIGMGGNITSEWRIKKFAGKLKQIASLLTGIPVEKFEDQDFKKTFLGPEWDQWRVTWKHGDDGPGSATFKTKEEAEKFIEDSFEDSLEEIVDAGLLKFEQMTVREFLQKLGTEGLRNGLHNQVWVNALFADYKEDDNVIITDVRFPNEAQTIKDKGGVVVRIERDFKVETKTGIVTGKHNPIDLHASETALDDWKFDYVINNNGTLEQLLEATKTLLNNIEN